MKLEGKEYGTCPVCGREGRTLIKIGMKGSDKWKEMCGECVVSGSVMAILKDAHCAEDFITAAVHSEWFKEYGINLTMTEIK